jgi:hypothetical protein
MSWLATHVYTFSRYAEEVMVMCSIIVLAMQLLLTLPMSLGQSDAVRRKPLTPLIRK